MPSTRTPNRASGGWRELSFDRASQASMGAAAATRTTAHPTLSTRLAAWDGVHTEEMGGPHTHHFFFFPAAALGLGFARGLPAPFFTPPLAFGAARLRGAALAPPLPPAALPPPAAALPRPAVRAGMSGHQARRWASSQLTVPQALASSFPPPSAAIPSTRHPMQP